MNMIRNSMYILIITLLITTAAWGQQNITIKPGDDVVQLINSVWEIDSTITFEAGFYPVSPDPENPTEDLFDLPDGATVKGAGGGMDPTTCTIIDMQYSFSKAFDINNPFITIDGLTVMRAIVHGVDLNETEAITFRDVWILKAFDALFNTDSGVDYVFENCVFGFGADELMKCNDTPAYVTFKNCDLFNVQGDMVECEGGSEMIFENCIFYAGSGAGNDNITEDGGSIYIRNSILWDPVDDGSDTASNDGGMELELLDAAFSVNESNRGEDPMYMNGPGFGTALEDLDLRIKEWSPALTVGSENFDDNLDGTGPVTFAGSQGPAPASVGNWALF